MESSATPVPDKALEHPEAQARQNPAVALKQIPDLSSPKWFRPATQTPVRWLQNLGIGHLGKFHHPARRLRDFPLARGMCALGFP